MTFLPRVPLCRSCWGSEGDNRRDQMLTSATGTSSFVVSYSHSLRWGDCREYRQAAEGLAGQSPTSRALLLLYPPPAPTLLPLLHLFPQCWVWNTALSLIPALSVVLLIGPEWGSLNFLFWPFSFQGKKSLPLRLLSLCPWQAWEETYPGSEAGSRVHLLREELTPASERVKLPKHPALQDIPTGIFSM